MAKDGQRIDLAVQRYRVMHREAIIGNFQTGTSQGSWLVRVRERLCWTCR
jgi:hypothetical protein